MSNTDQKPDDEKMNEVLKRMLETPPNSKEKDGGRSLRPRSKEDRKDRRDAKKAER